MHSKYKAVLAISLSIIFISSISAKASRLYSDIPVGHWSENAADVLGDLNIFQGVSSSEFGGTLFINRYDVARAINGLLGKRTVPTNIILLSDIRAGHPDFKSIQKILSASLMNTLENKFNGEKKVSRYDFATYILKTLEYLQADPLSIRTQPKPLNSFPLEKREMLDKVVNKWQLSEGYTDWDANINRYGALEMIARAAIILNPDLKIRIGEINRDFVIQPTPVSIEPTPIPVQTPVIVDVTPIPTPLSTPTPVQTPVVIDETPVPTPFPTIRPTPRITPISTPKPTPEVIKTPMPFRTPVLSTPTPEPMITPNVVPTPIAIPTPVISTPIPIQTPIAIPTPVLSTPNPILTPIPSGSKTNDILRNQATLRGFYNFSYSERIPSVYPVTVELVRSKNDILGFALNGDVSYWFKDYDMFIVKDMGINFKFNSLGAYVHPTETATVKPDTEISETFKANFAVLYKVFRTSEMEFAAGLDTYFRGNGRSSQKPIVDSYWRASKSYLGIGAKGIFGYKIMDKIVLESALGLHYVAQTINEKINYSGTTQPVTPQPGQQDGNLIDRFDIELDIGGRMDLLKFEANWLYADVNLGARFLLGDGSQSIIGGGAGVGISF